MSGAILLTDIALTAAVGLLVIVLTIVRGVIRRRRRRDLHLRPDASRDLARYVAGVGPEPRPASRGEHEALRAVALTAITDLTGSEREMVARLLADAGYVREAMAGLRSRRRSKRRRAAEELVMIDAPIAVRALTAGMDDRDALVRTSCARKLAEIGDLSLAPRIAAVAAHDMAAVPGAAAAVVLALGRRDPATLRPLLAPDAPGRVRQVAVTVAGRLRLAQLAPSLRACLSGGDSLAAAAAEGLGMIGDIDAAGGLARLARDPGRPAARAAAATALGAIGDPSAAGVLEPLLSARDWSLREAAAGALARLGEAGDRVLRHAVSAGPAAAREQAEAVLSG